MGLEERILGAIEGTRYHEPVRRKAPIAVIAFGFAGAAAALAIALLVSREMPVAPGTAPAPDHVVTIEGTPQAIVSTSIAAIDAVPRGMRSLMSGTATAPDNPLEREVAAVYSDSRSVLRFLALNFLPEVPAALSEDAGGPAT